MGLYCVDVRNDVQTKNHYKANYNFFGNDYLLRKELSTSLVEKMESLVVCSGTKGAQKAFIFAISLMFKQTVRNKVQFLTNS